MSDDTPYDPYKKRGPVFTPTVSVGNIITIIVFAVGLFGHWMDWLTDDVQQKTAAKDTSIAEAHLETRVGTIDDKVDGIRGLILQMIDNSNAHYHDLDKRVTRIEDAMPVMQERLDHLRR
jgi:hypothetical protein